MYCWYIYIFMIPSAIYLLIKQRCRVLFPLLHRRRRFVLLFVLSV